MKQDSASDITSKAASASTVPRVRKGSSSLCGCLDERGATESELEMLDLPGCNAEEGIQRLRGTVMLAWASHVRPSHPPWEGPEDMPFTTTVRNKFGRGAQHPRRAL